MDRHAKPIEHADLLEECKQHALNLLHENLSLRGILAASRTQRAGDRGYCAIFGRDASICAIGMGISGDPILRQGALQSLATLAEHQAPSGPIPNIVDERHEK